MNESETPVHLAAPNETLNVSFQAICSLLKLYIDKLCSISHSHTSVYTALRNKHFATAKRRDSLLVPVRCPVETLQRAYDIWDTQAE